MDPRRLLDDPAGLSELENRVLTAASAAPGDQLKQRIWSALSARLPPGGGASGGEGGSVPNDPTAAGAAGASGALGGAATAASAGGKSVALASIVKAASIGVSLGVVATTTAFTLVPDRAESDRTAITAAAPRPGAAERERAARRGDPARAAAAVTEPSRAANGSAVQPTHAAGEPIDPGQVAQTAAPAPLGGETEPGARVVVSPGTASVARFPVAPAPAAAPPPEPEPAPVSSQRADLPAKGASSAIREESRLVAAARDALRSGNAGRALALLERARREFPRGTLAQEREALSIEALAASGQTKVAAERARRFLDAHPSSMHAARVRSFARTP
jgi:hypothetical protein